MAVRTYLRMATSSELRMGEPPLAPAELVLLEPCTVNEWRALYRAIGAPWRWHDRDAWSDQQLGRYLAQTSVRVYRMDTVLHGMQLEGAGFFELRVEDAGNVEIVYIGIDERAFGQGLGRWIVSRAVQEAWALGAHEVTLNTCTLDSAAALPNYLARGFTVVREERYHPAPAP